MLAVGQFILMVLGALSVLGICVLIFLIAVTKEMPDGDDE